jgi:glyoxylase-like metal-dependent hydrolase (beta-lactamase superfamily II)
MLEGQGGNITVAVGTDGIIMVDGQFAPLSAKIKAAIAAISPLPIKYLINTHFHGDHTGGNENFAKDGAIVVAQDNIRVRLACRHRQWHHRRQDRAAAGGRTAEGDLHRRHQDGAGRRPDGAAHARHQRSHRR